jgi:hypothetical protein
MSDTTLSKAAPVGATVVVETITPGHVQLYVEAPNGDFNHITNRAASLLNVDYDSETDTAEGDSDLARQLSVQLHGSADALVVVEKSR